MTTITVTSVTKDSPGAGQVTIVGTYASQTFTQPAQQTTVGELPAGNPSFSRMHRITDAAHFVLRNGANGVAMLINSFAKIAFALENTLTYEPYFTTQPSAASTAFAKATLTSDATNVTNNDTVTLGSKTYTFKTALTPTEGEVLIGATAAETLDNLKLAVNRTDPGANDGVKYKVAAAHTQVQATTNTDTTQLFVSLIVGTSSNAYASTEASTHLAFGGATFSGGTAAAAFTVVIDSELSGTTYAWYESADGTTYGAALTNTGIYSGATSATLTITPTDTSKTGYYYKCIATNAVGSRTSTAKQLTVT